MKPQGVREVSTMTRTLWANTYFSEYARIVAATGKVGNSRTLVASIKLVKGPFVNSPTNMNITDSYWSYDWDGTQLIAGPSYTYESAKGFVAAPAKDVPPGHHLWVVRWTGLYGGRFSEATVYVNSADSTPVYTGV